MESQEKQETQISEKYPAGHFTAANVEPAQVNLKANPKRKIGLLYIKMHHQGQKMNVPGRAGYYTRD